MHINSGERPEITSGMLAAYTNLFFVRRDVYAVQRDDGKYTYKQAPITHSLVQAHFAGEVTLGTYCLDHENRAQWAVIDADTDETWHKLIALACTANLPMYLEQSRRGGHLWLFFERRESGKEARQFARALIAGQGIEKIEIFPKQETLADGPGSLIRAPFGFHRKVKLDGQPGQRFLFQHPDGIPLAPSLTEQLALVIAAQRVSHVLIQQMITDAPAPKPTIVDSPQMAPHPTNTEMPLSERIKASIGVYEFVSQYITLDKQSRGFCPFHDDQQQSFGVNRERNYWSCFAGCGGGSIIDFWMRWRTRAGQDGSFTATIAELAVLLHLPRSRPT